MSTDLRLVSVTFSEVRFHLDMCDSTRQVAVQVGSGRDWLSAVRFPHLRSDEGASLGDDLLDEEVRARAAEELVRLEAAVNIASGRAAA